MKKIVYIDMDDTICDYSGAAQASLKRNPGIAFPQSQYRFFANLKPIAGALETIINLENSEEYIPFILTAPSVPNPMSYTEKREWIERYLGYEFCKKLILCPNKGLMRGEFLIDDYSCGKGQENFIGELLQYGSALYPDWASIQRRLKL